MIKFLKNLFKSTPSPAYKSKNQFVADFYKSKHEFITQQDLYTYYAVFYEHMHITDVEVRAFFLNSPFNTEDYLLPQKHKPCLGEKIGRELEYIKPIIRKFTNDYMTENPNYKYWQIIGNYNKTIMYTQKYS